MSATVTKLSSNKIRIDFTVDAERFEKGIVAAYRKNVGKINIQGFRKGKAPRRVIEMQYGEGVFYEDAIDDIFPEVYMAAIQENKLEPVDRPQFNLVKAGHGEPLEFNIEVFVKPDVTLGQYKGLAVHKGVTEVTEDDVKAEIERARERASTFVDVSDRPAKLDDQVKIDYEGSIEGVLFEGGAAKDHNLTLGSGSFIPGFEEQVVGMSVGEEKDITVTFPEDYHAENLKGKPAVFHVKLNAIQEKEIPALDDEFAKDVSEFDTLDAYKQSVEDKLKKDAAERDNNAFENELMEQAVENAEIDVPQPMIDEAVEEQIQDMKRRMSYQGIDMDMYLKYTGTTMEQLRENYKAGAESRVRTQLVVEAIQNAENVEASDEDIEKEIEDYAARSGMEVAKIKEQIGENKSYFADAVKARKVFELLKDTAVEPTEDTEKGE